MAAVSSFYLLFALQSIVKKASILAKLVKELLQQRCTSYSLANDPKELCNV